MANDKWIVDLPGSLGTKNEAARREAENARPKLVKLDEPKGYEKRLKAEAAKSAKLRALRLAKEAEDRAAAPPSPKPRRPAGSTEK